MAGGVGVMVGMKVAGWLGGWLCAKVGVKMGSWVLRCVCKWVAGCG